MAGDSRAPSVTVSLRLHSTAAEQPVPKDDPGNRAAAVSSGEAQTSLRTASLPQVTLSLVEI